MALNSTAEGLEGPENPITLFQEKLYRQRDFFGRGATRSLDFRRLQLTRLHAALKSMEADILLALATDLGKSNVEAYMSEIGFLYEEISYTAKHLKRWMKPQRVHTPLVHQPTSSHVYAEPKGVVLVIAPWNYPVMLSLAPMIGAIAAGNCVVLKPSELAPATEALLRRLIEMTFPPDLCQVVCGGSAVAGAILRERFDHIFFTGSTKVGRIVMKAAAEHLTPVTLELGGKSPCLVDRDIDIQVTARRVAWGKFYNAGQTCVAPDYLLVHRELKAKFIAALRDELQIFYGADIKNCADYGRIIDRRNFDRLTALIDSAGKIVIGGGRDQLIRYIEPTVIDEVRMSDPVMAEEIFGPVLPVLDYETLDEALDLMKQRPQPLACYVFSRNRAFSRRVLEEFSFGGGCINNTLIHLVNANLPFGGVGPSGMGTYHGRYSFDTLSHFKAVSHSLFFPDVRLRYPPYRFVAPIMRLLMR